MYYIYGKHDNDYYVVDTSDNAKELLTADEITKAVSLGYKISGVDNGVILIESDYFIKDIIKALNRFMAKYIAIGNYDSDKYKVQVDKIINKFGFTTAVASAPTKLIILNELDICFEYEDDSGFFVDEFEYENEIVSTRVSETNNFLYSTADYSAPMINYIELSEFKNISMRQVMKYREIGSKLMLKSYTFHNSNLMDLINEFCRIEQIAYGSIKYVGYFFNTHGFYVITADYVCRLQFGEENKLLAFKDDLLNSSSFYSEGFIQYALSHLETECKGDDIILIQSRIRPISTGNWSDVVYSLQDGNSTLIDLYEEGVV